MRTKGCKRLPDDLRERVLARVLRTSAGERRSHPSYTLKDATG